MQKRTDYGRGRLWKTVASKTGTTIPTQVTNPRCVYTVLAVQKLFFLPNLSDNINNWIYYWQAVTFYKKKS